MKNSPHVQLNYFFLLHERKIFNNFTNLFQNMIFFHFWDQNIIKKGNKYLFLMRNVDRKYG